jgi:hypothetical protein
LALRGSFCQQLIRPAGKRSQSRSVAYNRADKCVHAYNYDPPKIWHLHICENISITTEQKGR